MPPDLPAPGEPRPDLPAPDVIDATEATAAAALLADCARPAILCTLAPRLAV
jgi:hypothetical protein